MKKFVSVLLVLCCLMASCVPALADEPEMTGGELLAMHFVKEFYAEDKGNGEAYFVTFDAANKHFIVHGHYPLLESLIVDDPENYQQMVDKLETLFASIDDLIRVCLEEPDAYYMTLSFGLSRLSLESSAGEYLCISSKGGTVHRVNAELVSTSEIKFYVANENAADAATIQAAIDFFTAKGAMVHGVVCYATQNPNNNGFSLSISGEYCNKFAEGYKGKDSQWVSVPDRYVIDCRKVANDYGLDDIGLLFRNEQGDTFGLFSFQHSSWYGYYYAIDD